MEQELSNISMSLFGTEDYESALSVLPAYDGAVKEFRRQARLLDEKYGKGKDE